MATTPAKRPRLLDEVGEPQPHPAGQTVPSTDHARVATLAKCLQLALLPGSEALPEHMCVCVGGLVHGRVCDSEWMSVMGGVPWDAVLL